MTLSPIFVDTYAGDFDGKPNIAALAAAGYPWVGHIMKASQGLWYPNAARGEGEWFDHAWNATRDAAPDRYGNTWFRGAYHYADLASDARAQARFANHRIASAGGWDRGDLPLMVDVETAGNPPKISAAHLVEWISAFAAETKSLTGSPPILYGNIYLWEHGFTVGAKCGCPWIWPARYTATLPREVTERLGYTLDELLAWQYAGTEPQTSVLDGYPTASPIAPGRCDLSVVTIAGGGEHAMQWLREHTYGR